VAKSYTITRVPIADLVAIAVGGLITLLAYLGAPAELLDELDPEHIATLLTSLFGVLIALAAAIRSALWKHKIDDPTLIGDRSLKVSDRPLPPPVQSPSALEVTPRDPPIVAPPLPKTKDES
jgi:hypothetical protein